MAKKYCTKAVAEFICTAEKCEDTCCKHWSMQVDAVTLEKYKKEAPELLDCVEEDAGGVVSMRKDGEAGYCVKLENGRCGIQNKYGEKFLGDACYFYPRIIRRLGDDTVVTATMSCPEIARSALAGDVLFGFEEKDFSRIPQNVKNILPDDVTAEDAFSLHKSFIDVALDETGNSMQNYLRIASVSRSLARLAKKDWSRAAPMYFRLAGSVLPEPEININDPFNLLHSLCGLAVASKRSVSPRLKRVIEDMEKALCVTIDWVNVQIHTSDYSLSAYNNLQKLWREKYEKKFDVMFKRWLAAQLSAAFYPFAGLGDDSAQKITIIGVRMAILKLALMSLSGIGGGELRQDDVVRVAQSLSRFLEHLADPAFSIAIYNEAGWSRESGMAGLLC